jgi:hypothetical protein
MGSDMGGPVRLYSKLKTQETLFPVVAVKSKKKGPSTPLRFASLRSGRREIGSNAITLASSVMVKSATGVARSDEARKSRETHVSRL